MTGRSWTTRTPVQRARFLLETKTEQQACAYVSDAIANSRQQSEMRYWRRVMAEVQKCARGRK